MAIRFLSNETIDGTLIVSKPATGSVEIAKFKVDGTGGTTGNLSYVSIIPGSSNFSTQLRLHTNALGTYQSISNISGVLTLATNDSNPMEFKTNSVTRLTISGTGTSTLSGALSGTSATFAGNVTIGSASTNANRSLTILADDTKEASINLYGNSQGTGVVYVGQSSTYGGGIVYNGDGSPVFGNSTTDTVSFYRREAGTNSEVFRYSYSGATVTFIGAIEALGITTSGVTNNFSTGVGWGTNLSLTNTNDDASPAILTFRKAPVSGYTSVADGDYVGFINFRMDNTNNDEFSWVEMAAIARDVTDGSEDSSFSIGTWGAGTEHPYTIMARSGNVGIGNVLPHAPLSIYTPNNTLGSSIAIQNNISGTGATQGFYLGIATSTIAYVWNYENDDLVFATNNIERMRINAGGTIKMTDENGGVPILQVRNFSTSATGAFTDVYAMEFRGATTTGAIGGMMLLHNNEADDTRPTLNVSDSNGIFATFTNGKVGIGTASPGAKLEVRSDAANPDYGVYFYNSGGGRVLKIYNTDWDAGDNLIYASNGGTANPSLGYEFVVTGNAKVHLTASDAYFEAAGAGGTPGTDSMLYGQNSTKVGYVWNRSTISTAHILFGTSSTERMRITSAGEIHMIGGNVGIGTTAPTYGKLQIHTASAIGYTPTSFMSGTNIRLQTGGTAATNVTTGISMGVGGAAEAYIGAVQNASTYADVVFQTYHGAYGQRMRILSNGNVVIGTETSTSCTLKVSSTKNGSESDPHFCITGNGYTALHFLNTTAYYIVQNSSGRSIRIVSNTNGVKLDPGATAWTSNSDIALKENIKPLENVLDKIKDYRCVEYNLKNAPEDKKIGFIAQDWVDDFPVIVNKDEKDMLGMKYTETIPVLLKAIQELEARVKELENK